MSTNKLRSNIAGHLSTYLNGVVKRDTGRGTSRARLQKKAALLLVTDDQLYKGSLTIVNGKKSFQINKSSATIIIDIIKRKVIPKFNKFSNVDVKNAINKIKKNISKSSSKYHHITTKNGIFRIDFTGTLAENITEDTVKVQVKNIGYIPVTGGYLFIAPDYRTIQTKIVSVISKEIMKEIKNDSKTNKAIRDTYGQIGGKAQAEVGHIDIASIQSGTITSTAQRERISSALTHIPKANLLKNIGFSVDMQKSIIEALKRQALEEFSNLGVRYNTKLIKKVSDLGNSGMSFEAILHVVQSHQLNAEILGKAAGLERELVTRLLSKSNLKYLMNQLVADNIPGWESSPSFIASMLNTIKHLFFTSIKKVGNKLSFKVKVPKTKPSKDSITKASGIVPISMPQKIRKIALEIDEEITSNGLSLDIVLPSLKEDTCKISTEKLLAIKGRLNYELHDAIKANMKLPALVYRTGRFAKSARIITIKQNPDCSLTAFYNYMTRPYSVFDPSISSYRGLSSPTRDPQKIIGDSIRSIAQGIMRDRYTIHPQWV